MSRNSGLTVLVVFVYSLLSLLCVSFIQGIDDLYLALLAAFCITVVSMVYFFYMKRTVRDELKREKYHWLQSVLIFVLVYAFPLLILLGSWFILAREYSDWLFSLLRRPPVIGWATAIVTLLAVVVALFQKLISQSLIKPKLFCVLENKHPYRVVIPQYRSANGCFGTIRKYNGDAVYFRIGVRNIGNGVARNVEVFLKEIHYLCDDSGLAMRNHKLSMNLGWSNIESHVKSYIYPQSERYCDIGVLVEPEYRVSDDRFLKGSECQGRFDDSELAFMISASHKLGDCEHILGPGKYELIIDIEAENFEKEEHRIKIMIGTGWIKKKDDSSLNRMICCESV